MENKQLNLAGQGQRILNFIIDISAILLIWISLSIMLLLLGLNQTYRDETGEQLPIVPFVILLPTFWGYYILAEYKFQMTLGKVLSKTKVVSLAGTKPTLKQIIIRTLSRSIPFEYLSYLATVQGIHDRISKTRTIKK